MNGNEWPRQTVRSEVRDGSKGHAAAKGEADQGPSHAGAADPVWLSSFLGRHFPQHVGTAAEAAEVSATTLSPPESDAERGLREAALSYRQFRLQHETTDSAEVEAWLTSFAGNAAPGRLFRDLHLSNPRAARQLADALTAWPEAGSDFLGFHLRSLLGRGAFGRVFLAEQGELASRLVALKISTELVGESQTLAQLHHAHIVPIYSVHRAGPFQAVCMPYFGATTLADVLNDLSQGEAVPVSGKALVSTLYSRRSATQQKLAHFGAMLEERAAAPANTSSQPHAASSADTLKLLEGLTYVQAVLWLAERLADGLTHAHERGILHRDLKPANVLLTDEGQPMLLDFNLAEDTKLQGQAAASLGGTLPYMAPEHLEAIINVQTVVDARSDVYSFGVLLFELLTGRHPFPDRRGLPEKIVPGLLEDRRGPPPTLRNLNSAITPAVESIVRQCLDPNPARRYQSAADLREDLERHRRSLPLRHAPDPSLPERVRKWQARHPRLVSAGSVGTVAAVLLFGLVLLLMARSQRLARMEALDTFDQFRDELRAAQFLLNARTLDREQREEGITQCRQALDRYQILEDPHWLQRPDVCQLPSVEQQHLREDAGELLLLLARATSLQADERAPDGGLEQIRAALQWNERAEGCYLATEVPQALLTQRAKLLRRLGQDTQARDLQTQATTTPLRTARDHYLAAAEHVSQGRYREALPLVQQATDKDPQAFWAWYVLGLCHDGLAHDAETLTCFSICTVLAPQSPWAWFNRGLAHLKRQDHALATSDFDRALLLRPGWADAYLNRAIARQGQGHYEPAIADITRALDLGTSHTRAYFMRARIRELAGDLAGAQRDRVEGRRQEPTDEKSWIARGVDRMETQSEAALADFEAALVCNPHSRAALQNKGYVLAEKLQQPRAALAVLDQAIALYPDYAAAWAGRGILHARLGERAAALRDAEAALARDTHPATYYQVAGIYALTSTVEPDDRRQAFHLLSTALRKGYGFALLETDHDLDALRAHPDFSALVHAARALHPSLTRPGAQGERR